MKQSPDSSEGPFLIILLEVTSDSDLPRLGKGRCGKEATYMGSGSNELVRHNWGGRRFASGIAHDPGGNVMRSLRKENSHEYDSIVSDERAGVRVH
jgi:hypothetical protein